MKRIHDSHCSASADATGEKFEKFNLDLQLGGYIAARRLSGQGQWQRSKGIMMSGLLIMGLLIIAVFAAPTASPAASIAVGISVGIAPPPIPVYTQPVCPGPGFMWTPGYWAYNPATGYFWVPGTWVVAPAVGLLWTPGYWGWGGAAFVWHAGYWGSHVGFYGGINYGFGYGGVGFVGGEWRGGAFFYNRSVANIGGGRITNVYYRRVENNFAVNRVSYNGGAGGLSARPTPGELAAEHDRHIGATSLQQQHEMAARNDRSQYSSVNHGKPGVAATARPGEFRGAGVVQASRTGGSVNSGGYHNTNAGHTNGYSGFHNANPGGGGTHQLMTAHHTSPSSHNYGSRQTGGATSQYHSAPASRHQVSRAAVPSHQSASHQQQTRQQSSRPSEGGRSEPHGR
jgi:hypothetical protein